MLSEHYKLQFVFSNQTKFAINFKKKSQNPTCEIVNVWQDIT